MKRYTKLILVSTLALALTGCATTDTTDPTTNLPNTTTVPRTTAITPGTTSGLGAGDVTVGTTSKGIIGDTAETVASAVTGTTMATTTVK